MDTPNAITPRLAAVALLHEAVQRAEERAEHHERHSPDLSDYTQSRIRVFLRQTAVELRLAARLLVEHPDPPPGEHLDGE